MVQIKFLFMFLFTILLLGSVNALDLDNYKVYNETIGNYGKIEVWENEFISSDYKISDYTLIEHKSDMFTGYSKIKVKVFEESRLMDNIFEKNNKEIETLNIKFSRITYENKPKQIRVCEIKSSININSSEEYFYNDCNYVFNYSDMEEK